MNPVSQTQASDSSRRSTLVNCAVFAALVATVALARVMPHVPNVTPAAAAAIFAGFFFRGRVTGIALAVVAMLAGDALIGFDNLPTTLVIYASLALPVLAGGLLRGRHFLWTAGASLAASELFFFTTNGAVWAFGHMYAKTWAGLGECYTAGVPFFRYTLLGDLAWTAAIFGAYYACVLVRNVVISARTAQTVQV